MTRRLFAFSCCLLLLAVLPACDSADPEQPETGLAPGEGTVTISGSLERSYSGQAFFTIVDDDDFGPTLLLGVVPGQLADATAENYEVIAIGGPPTRPEAGTYPLVNLLETQTGYYGLYANTTPTREEYAISVEGSLSIESSTESAIVGSYQFDGLTFVFTQEGTSFGSVETSVSFHATYVDPEELPDGIDTGLRPEQARPQQVAR